MINPFSLVAIARVLDHEKGYSNKKSDKGGETNFGISKRAYPHLDIKNLTVEQAKTIYMRDYWNILPQKLPNAVLFQLLDFAVNSGPSMAIRHLQHICGVKEDGHWGSISQAAAEKFPSYLLATNLLAERMEFQASLSDYKVNGAGWTNRNAKNLRYAMVDTH